MWRVIPAAAHEEERPHRYRSWLSQERNLSFPASKRTNDSEVVGRFPGKTVKEIYPLVKERTIVKWWGYAFLYQSTKKERKKALLARNKAL